MIFGHEELNRVHGLPQWLEIATETLAAPAKERIRTEIEAHYSESVAAHLAEGASESDAQAAALTELGSAKAAARRFRRQHLTEKEAGLLRKWGAASSFGLVAGYLSFCCLLYFLYFVDPEETHYLNPATFFAVEFLTMVIFSTALFLVARSKIARRKFGLVNLLYSVNVSFSTLALWYYISRHHHSLVLLMFSAQLIRPLRIWYKLRNVQDAWQEMPPPQAASS
jgi:hypothetical protein